MWIIIFNRVDRSNNKIAGYHQLSHTFKAMGGPCCFHLYHEDEQTLKAAVQLAEQEVLRLEKKYSRFLEDSVLSHINQSAGKQAVGVDIETQGLLNYASLCFEQSDGLFDITSGVLSQIWDFKAGLIPDQNSINRCLKKVGFDKLNWDGESLYLPKGMHIDFGGVVKEFAADSAQRILTGVGIASGLVDLAGDMVVLGNKPDNSPWLVGIRNPNQPEKAIVTLQMSSGAIATSGYYERYFMVDGKRYCHIINPKTGWPVAHCATISIISDQCLVSGSVATIAMLKEDEAARWLQDIESDFYMQDRFGNHFSSQNLNTMGIAG